MEAGKEDELSYSDEDNGNVFANFTCPAPG
jgi:hypothetical protein